MNSEQIKSMVRQAMLWLSGMVAGVSFISKFFTPDQVAAIFTSETVVALIASAIGTAIASTWAIITRSDKNLVASADAVPGVQGVITKPTMEGAELAQSVPSTTVVQSGTPAAAAMVR